MKMVLCRPGDCPDRNGNVGGYFCPSPLVPNVPVRTVAGGSAVGTLMLSFHIKTYMAVSTCHNEN